MAPATPRPAAEEDLDPANRSLAEALRVSFGVLRLALLALLVVFALSGSFKVKEGEVAVRLHFGAVEGPDERPVFAPGGPYFAWPEPIDTVIRVPTSPQQLTLDQPFWFRVAPGDELKPLDQLPAPKGGLAPDRDGSVLTADQNVMHGQWAITWQVPPEGAAKFVQNVSASSDRQEMLAQAGRVLRCAAEQAIVQAVAQSSADDFVRGNVDWDARARARLQATLDALGPADHRGSGLLVTKVGLVQQTPPLAVRAAFKAVSEAQGERTRLIVDAETNRAKLLGEAAGDAYPVLLHAINLYDQTRRRGETDRAARVETALAAFLRGESADACFQRLVDAEPDAAAQAPFRALLVKRRVSGRAYELVEKARAEGNKLVDAVRGEVNTFQKLLEQHRKNPRVSRDRLWQDTVNRIFAGDVERFYLPPGAKEVYLELNRDPAIRKRQEQEKYERQQQDLKAKAGRE